MNELRIEGLVFSEPEFVRLSWHRKYIRFTLSTPDGLMVPVHTTTEPAEQARRLRVGQTIRLAGRLAGHVEPGRLLSRLYIVASEIEIVKSRTPVATGGANSQ